MVRAVQLNKIFQVAILGSVTGLGEFDTKGQLSATWLVYGCGEYGPIAVGENFTTYGPVNRAVDVYLDEWVKFACFATRGYSATKCQCIPTGLFI